MTASPSSAPVLRADGVSVSFGGRAVLTDITLAADPGHRIGLVGENGVGKTTLIRVLAGVLEPDSGTVQRPPDLGLLHQELPHPPGTPAAAVVEQALAAVKALVADLESAAAALGRGPDDERAAQAYDDALAAADRADVWDVEHRTARTLAGLGLASLMTDDGRVSPVQVGRMSGGQRTRLGLAALLLRRPAALLLDEPTNHLDDEAAAFLATEVAGLRGAVVMASHDRVFLEEVATEIVDLDPASSPGAGPVTYGGRYSDYLQQRQVERLRWQQRYDDEQGELKGLRHSVAVTARDVAPDRGRRDNDKMQYDFKTGRVDRGVSRRVRNAALRLEELERGQVRKPRPELRLDPPQGRVPADGLVAWARGAVVPGRLDMTAAGLPDLQIGAGARLLVTGANGSGKSTLLHLLAGDLQPAAGVVGVARGVRVGLLEQDLDLDEEARTPRGLLAATSDLPGSPRSPGSVGPVGSVGGDRPAVDAHGLLAPRDLDRPVGELSVGTRRRVVLAMLLTQAPDLLLLDEPTNHISLALADELTSALAGWPGAVVVASHDRWLRRHWDGEVAHLVGSG